MTDTGQDKDVDDARGRGLLWAVARNVVRSAGLRDPLVNAFVGARTAVRRRRREAAFRRFCNSLPDKGLSDQVTAVIITTDAGHFFDRCRVAVERQLLKPGSIEVVRNVSPFSRASQAALDLVKTPYYVPVDDDMVLDPTCFARLYRILAEDPQCAEALARLMDPIMGNIVGVRMYRTEIVREIGFYPLADEKGCERKMIKEIARRGYLSTNCHITEGIHHPCYLPHEIFWKFRFAAEEARYYGDFEPAFRDLLDKLTAYWERTRDDIAIYGLAGLFDGLQSDQVDRELSHDGRLDHSVFRKVKAFLEDTSGADGAGRSKE